MVIVLLCQTLQTMRVKIRLQQPGLVVRLTGFGKETNKRLVSHSEAAFVLSEHFPYRDDDDGDGDDDGDDDDYDDDIITCTHDYVCTFSVYHPRCLTGA